MLYDLTSSYFEGHTCPLARRGHSRDGKRGTLQIVFGLLCTAQGCPIAVEDLAKVERAFRSMKTVDLKVRPIYHRSPDRVRAHVFLCMLAYYVEWHMRSALAPVLFDDHDREAGAQQRESVVRTA